MAEEESQQKQDDATVTENISEEIEEGLTTVLETFLNICYTIQALPILVIPYTFRTGGWYTLVAILIIAVTSNYTCYILVKSLYEEKNGVKLRVRNNYIEIGEAFWKVGGRSIVLVATVIELTCVSIMYPILVGELFKKSFYEANIPLWAWTLIGGAAFLPNALLKNLSQVAWTSIVAVACAGFILVTVVGYSATHIESWDIDKMDNFEPNEFPITIGILISCFLSQPYAPFIESTMKRPEKFTPTLIYAYLSMTAATILIGVITQITYFPYNEKVVTNNLPSGIFRQTVNSVAAVLAFTSYTLPMFVTFNIIENPRLQKTTKNVYSISILSTRLTLLLLTVLIAAFIPRFTYILAFVASMTGITLEFIFPALFHMKIYCTKLRWIEFALDVCVVFVGVLAMTTCLIVTWVSLYGCFVENACI